MKLNKTAIKELQNSQPILVKQSMGNQLREIADYLDTLESTKKQTLATGKKVAWYSMARQKFLQFYSAPMYTTKRPTLPGEEEKHDAYKQFVFVDLSHADLFNVGDLNTKEEFMRNYYENWDELRMCTLCVNLGV